MRGNLEASGRHWPVRRVRPQAAARVNQQLPQPIGGTEGSLSLPSRHCKTPVHDVLAHFLAASFIVRRVRGDRGNTGLAFR